MEILIAVGVGVVIGAIVVIAAVRRSMKKPTGKTAKAVSAVMGGPGPWRPNP